MASVEDLPADLRGRIGSKAIAPLAGPSGRPFIGSGTNEYKGLPPGGDRLADAAFVQGSEFSKASEAKSELKTCPRCKVSTVEDHNFCSNCGFDNKKRRPADTLGIEITDEDVQNYLFKGHIVKSVPLLGQHVLTFKTSQSQEVDEADELTEKHFEGRRPSDIEWLNYRSKVLIAFGWVKLDGAGIGNSAKERLEYIQGHGSQMLETVGRKYKLFQDAISEVLNGDTLGK